MRLSTHTLLGYWTSTIGAQLDGYTSRQATMQDGGATKHFFFPTKRPEKTCTRADQPPTFEG